MKIYEIGCFNSGRRIDMIEELEKMANLNIPKDFSSDEANKYLKDACTKYEIKCAPPEQQRVCWTKWVLCFVLFIFITLLNINQVVTGIVILCYVLSRYNICDEGSELYA